MIMILTKAMLDDYLEEDKKALGIRRKRPRILLDHIWRFEILLRKAEYHTNLHHSIRSIWYKFWYYRLGIKLGFTVPLNVCGKGLNLVHVGTVIISPYAKIGNYVRIHAGVNIGVSAGSKEAPTIGDRVYIGPGAKIYGGIKIGNDVAIGANAVVNHSFNQDEIAIAGVPARVINNRGSIGLLYSGI